MDQTFDTATGKDGSKFFEQCELTAAEMTAWDKARTALLWQCPAFTHVLYTMMDNAKSKHTALFTRDPAVKTAATDGVNLIINPDYFFKFSLSEQVFIIAHEIFHAILNHCGQSWTMQKAEKVITASGKSLPYSPELMNVAQDLVINDALITAKVGLYNKEWLHQPKIATGNDSAVDIYAKLFKKAPPMGGQKQFDNHLAPGSATGTDPSKAVGARSEQQWKGAVAAGAAAAKAMGKLPSNLEAMFSDLLEPKVDWKEKIQTFFARRVGGGAYNWKTADRRLIVRDIYAPGRSGNGAGTVVIGFDTSGSIYADKGLVDRFLSEVGGIISDVNPERLIVLWCDAYVHRSDEVDSCTDLLGLKPVGGGGTDFDPVFDWINKNLDSVDALVYLTDGYGNFPRRAPNYPVLWGDVSGGRVQYPFGEVVEIPTENER